MPPLRWLPGSMHVKRRSVARGATLSQFYSRRFLEQAVWDRDAPVRPCLLLEEEEEAARTAVDGDGRKVLGAGERDRGGGDKRDALPVHRQHVGHLVQRLDDGEPILGLHTRAHLDGLGNRAHLTRGPAARTSGETVGANSAKFSSKLRASEVATRSYSALSGQVWRGCSTSPGTPGQLAGTPSPKIGS